MIDSRPARDREPRYVNMSEFYEEISKGNRELYAKINEALYINAHTIYLSDDEKVNSKKNFSDKWQREFGRYPSTAQYDYIFRLYPFFMSPNMISVLKKGKIISDKMIWISLTRLEMDLKLIEYAEQKFEFTKKSFRDYMNDKYRFTLENVLDNIEKADIPFTENFKKLGDALLPFKEKIQKIYENVLSANDETIKNGLDSGKIIRVSLARETGSEIRPERRNIEPSKAPVTPKSEVITKPEPVTKSELVLKPEDVTKPEGDAVIKLESTEIAEPITDLKVSANVEASAEKKSDSDKERVIKDYEMLISDYEEKIKRLERDLEEYKRQLDELRTYSVGRYDSGVKDFFHTLNDKRYGRPLDFLYRTFLFNQHLEPNLHGILENFFMALEESDIEPIVQIEKSLLADPTRLKKSCDLEFDIKDLVPEKVYFKYVGWKYKDAVIEKPTLAKKND